MTTQFQQLASLSNFLINFRLISGTTVQIEIPSAIDTNLNSGDNLGTCKEEWKRNVLPTPTSGSRSITNCVFTSGSPQYFSFTSGLTMTSGASATYSVTFGSFANPSSTKTITTFSIYMTGTPNGSKTSGMIPTYTTATWISAGVTITSVKAGQITGSDYTFTFKNRNTISAGGYIELEFPTAFSDVDLIVAAATLTVTVDGFTKTGKVVSTSGQIVKISNIFDSALSSGKTIKLVFTSLQNPGQIVTTGSFKITSYDAASGAIDKTSTGMTVSITQAGTITFTVSASVPDPFILYDHGTNSDSVYLTGNEAWIDVFLTPSVIGSDGGYFEFAPPENFFFASSVNDNIAAISGTFELIEIVEDGNKLKVYVNPLTGATSNTELRIQLGFWTIGYAATTVGQWEVKLKSSSDGIVAEADTASLAMTTITVTGQAITNVSVTRDRTALSGPVALTLTFTPATKIISGNWLKVTIPSDSATFLQTDTLECTTGTGTSLTCTWDADAETVKIQSPCGAAGCTAKVAATVVIDGLTNPNKIVFVEPTFGLMSFTTIAGTDYTTDTFAGTAFLTSLPLTPGELTSMVIARTDTGTPATGGDVVWTFEAILATEIEASTAAGLRIIFPAGVGYMPTTHAATSDGGAVTAVYNADADDTTEISYVDVYACEAGCSADDLLTLTVSAKNAYHNGDPDSLEFTFRAITDGAYSDEGKPIATAFTLEPHAFTSTPTISSDDVLMVGDTVSLKFSVTPFNRLPSSGDNGSLTVTLPSEVKAASCTCDATDDDSNDLNCSYVSASKSFKVTYSTQISGGTQIDIETSDCVTLPSTGTPTSEGFSFATFYGTAEIDYQQSASFQADTFNEIKSLTVARQGDDEDYATAGAAVEYKLTFTTTNSLPSAANRGRIKVYIPSSQINGTPVPAVDGSETKVVSHGVEDTYYTVLLTSTCTKSAGCTSLSFVLSGFSNAASTAAPTESWKLETYIASATDDDTLYKIDSIDSGVIATPFIRLGTLKSLTVSRVGDTVGTAMVLTFSFKFSNSIDSSQDEVYFSFPNELFYKGSDSPTCTFDGASVSESTCDVEVDTDLVDDFGDAVTFLTVSTTNCGTCATVGNTVRLVVSGLLNPYSEDQISSGQISISTQRDGDIRDAGEINIKSTTFSSISAAILTLNSVTRTVTTVGAETDVELSVLLASNMERTGKLVVHVPTKVFVATGDDVKWAIGTVTGTAITGTATSTHLPITITAPCGTVQCKGSTNGASAFTLKLTQGFRNIGYVGTQTAFFKLYSQTSTGVACNELEASTTAATPVLTATTITVSSILLDSYLAGAASTMTLKIKFASVIKNDATHTTVFTFSQPFFRNDVAITCSNSVGTALTCTSTHTSNLVSAVSVTGLCSADCASSTDIQINAEVINYLEPFDITGSLTVTTATSAAEAIAVTAVGFDYGSMTSITKNFLTSPSVTRSDEVQGEEATYTIKFTTPGVLAQNPVILISLPKDQVVIQSDRTTFIVKRSSGTSITHTVPTASTTYNFLSIKDTTYPCGTSVCASGTVITIVLTGAANPFISTSNPSDFKIEVYNNAQTQLIADSTTTSPFDASPELEVGKITDMSVTHGASDTTNLALTRVGQVTDYAFNFKTSGAVPSGGFFRITLPSYRTVLSGAAFTCQDKLVGTVADPIVTYPCTGTIASNILTLKFTCTTGCAEGTQTLYVLTGLQNPAFVPTCGLPTTYWLFETTDSDGFIINTGQIECDEVDLVRFTELLKGSISVTRGTTDLATPSTYTFKFRVTTAVPKDGFFRLVLDSNQLVNGQFATCPSATCGSPVVVQDQVWIKVNQNCNAASGCAADSTASVTVSNLYNPSSLTANYPTTSFEIYTLNADGYVVDGYDTDIKAEDDLKGEKVQISSIRLEDLYTNTHTNVTVRFAPGTNLGKDATLVELITLVLPAGLAYRSDYDDQCYVDSIVDYAVACEFELDEDNEYLASVTLSGVCPAQGCKSDRYYGFKFPVLTRKDTYPLDGLTYFFITTSENGVDVAVGEKENQVVLEPFKISTYEAFADDECDRAGDYCTLNLVFKMEHNVPRSTKNGRILITLPTEIRLESRTCYAEYGTLKSSKLTCKGYYRTTTAGNDYLVVQQDVFDTTTDANFTVRVVQIKNPSTSAPTSEIVVLSQQYYSSGTDEDGNSLKGWYSIEGTEDLEKGFTYRVNRVSDLRRVAVRRFPLDNGSGLLAGNPTKVLVEIWPIKDIDEQASFIVQFPPGAQLALNPRPVSTTCYAANSLGDEIVRVYCETFAANRTVIVRNYCFATDACTAREPVVRFIMSNDFILNYPLVVEPLQDELHSLNVLISTDKTYYYVGQTNRKIFVQPTLQPNALIFINPEIIRTNSYINSQTSWVINFKTNTNAVDRGGSLRLAVPKDVMIYMGEVPLVKNYTNEAWTEIPDVAFTLHSDQRSIASVTVPNFCLATCEAGKAYSVSIERFRNPRQELTSRESITLTTLAPQGYLVERGITKPTTEVFSQLLPVRLQNVIIRPADPVPGKTTAYTISFSAEAEFDPTDMLRITFPPETTLLNVKGRLLAGTGRSCVSVFTPEVALSCSSPSANVLLVKGLFPSNIKQYALTVEGIKNMDDLGQTSNFAIEAMSAKGSLKAAKTTELRVTLLLEISDQTQCNRVCGSCAGTNTTCTSCAMGSKYPVWKRNTCVTSCSDGFFFDLQSKSCFNCHHACSTCWGPGNNACYGCAKGYTMNDGSCSDYCPTGFRADEETKRCVAPADQTGCNSTSNCLTCGKNKNICLTCDQDSEFPVLDRPTGKCIRDNQALCNGGDSSRWFIDPLSQECRKCNALCKTCSIQENKCTSCWDFFRQQLVNELYETCVERCGLGTFLNETANPSKCQYCNPVCLTCTGSYSNQCTVCNKTSSGRQLYLDQSQCVLSCPRGAATNQQANTCERGVADITGFWFLYGCLDVLFVVGFTLLSRFKSKKADSWTEVFAALLSGLEFLTRLFLLGNLWVTSSVFLLALAFMNLISTSVIGIFFNFLYMQPIYDHSPHFRTLFRRSRNAWIGVTIGSYFGGVHVMRLLTSKFMNIQAFSADLHTQKFYRQPLNLMSNATSLFTVFQLILDLLCFYYFALFEDTFGLALVSLVSCACQLMLQVSFHLKTKRFLIDFDAKKTNEVLRNKIQRFAEENPAQVPSEAEGPQAEEVGIDGGS